MTGVANWTRRSQLISFCVDVFDQSLTEKQTMGDGRGDQNTLKVKVCVCVIDSCEAVRPYLLAASTCPQ